MHPTDLARRLLGATLTSSSDAGRVSVQITETEAYAGADDPASHAFRGPTNRNAVMFGPALRLYVYRSYGVHWCSNVTCGDAGEPAAVLLRAGRIIEGRDLAQNRRGVRVPEHGLARGPGNLAQALDITGSDDGATLDGSGWLTLDAVLTSEDSDTISSGPRVGVSQAADRPWRFWVAGDPTVTAFRRSPRAGLTRQNRRDTPQIIDDK